MIGHVYRVRTQYPVLGRNSPHLAVKGTLAVVELQGEYQGRIGYYCQVVMPSGAIGTQHLRPCDLRRLEDHDFVNEVNK